MSVSGKAKAGLWLFPSERKHAAVVSGKYLHSEYRKSAEEIEYSPAIVVVEYSSGRMKTAIRSK